MNVSIRRWLQVGVGAVILFASLSACDNTIEPYSERANTYSIYGYLAESRQRQFIRVKPLDAPLSGEEARSMEATVQLENLSEGDTERLKDSVVYFEDQEATVITHNFWTDAPIEPETKYRVVVDHPDRVPTTATTTTPSSVRARTDPDSANCLTSYTVQFPPIKQARRIRVAVAFEVEDTGTGGNPAPPGNVGGNSSDAQTTTARYSISDAVRDGTTGGASVRFQPDRLLQQTYDSLDHPDADECTYAPQCLRLADDDIRIEYTYLSPDWYRVAPNDSVTFDPITSPYVENGAGFLGSLWRDEARVQVDTSELITVCPP